MSRNIQMCVILDQNELALWMLNLRKFGLKEFKGSMQSLLKKLRPFLCRSCIRGLL
jgi:hypothetical protein